MKFLKKSIVTIVKITMISEEVVNYLINIFL